MLDLGRASRIEEVKMWGATDEAAQCAYDVMDAMPEGAMFGIFPKGYDEGEGKGDGGINLERITDTSITVVEIVADGGFGECTVIRIGDFDVNEVEVTNALEAAKILAGTR